VNDVLICRDLYMRHTGADGKSFVQCHRVWDAEKFVATHVAQALTEAMKAKDRGEPHAQRAEQITEDVYLKERTK
jgi:hypothetical protein